MVRNLAVLAFLFVGCASPYAVCKDSRSEAAYMRACQREASPPFCACSFTYLADRFECSDFADITPVERSGAVLACVSH